MGHAFAQAGSGRREPVVAERALPGAAFLRAAIDHPVRARRHAIAAPVAHVLLDHDRAELAPEQRARRAHVEAGRVRAVLAHVAGHQPPQSSSPPSLLTPNPSRGLGFSMNATCRHWSTSSAPCCRRTCRDLEVVLRDVVPLLARHLARLAADADAAVSVKKPTRGGGSGYPLARAGSWPFRKRAVTPAPVPAVRAANKPGFRNGGRGHHRVACGRIGRAVPERRRACRRRTTTIGRRRRADRTT